MGISVADNFKHLSKKFLDDRESFDTLADMKAVSDSDIPEGFETYCKATDKRYKFLSTNAVDANTGKWREVEYGGGGTTDYADLENKPSIEGVPLTGNKTASDLGLAKANQIPSVPTKVSQLQNDSGFITNSDLPGVYAGDTAGLVPAAGSDNEGKYLDNDGNWTTVPMPMIGTINRSDIYDTTEKVIGKWTDGRPVYQKTITGTLANTTQEETVKATFASLGVSIQEFVDIHGVIFTDAGKCIQMSVTQLSSNQKINVLRMVGETNSSSSSEKNGIHIYNSWYTSGTNTYKITARYTKTTDAANSYNYADENDYSTSEKIIGKWIDGKPLYQKVFTGTVPNVTTEGTQVTSTVDISGLNIDFAMISEAAVINNNYVIRLPSVSGGTLNGSTPVLYGMYANVKKSANQLTIASTESKFNGRTYYIVLKYTKS